MILVGPLRGGLNVMCSLDFPIAIVKLTIFALFVKWQVNKTSVWICALTNFFL